MAAWGLRTWKTVEVESFEVYHRFRNEVLLLSLLEESPGVEYAHFDERIDVLGGEFLFREALLVFPVVLALLKTGVFTNFAIFIPGINRRRLFLVFGKLSGCGLLLYETGGKSVGIGHETKWSRRWDSNPQQPPWQGGTLAN